jgi:putative tryptophan/tyrosine transport system substrate-binding protein
LAANDEKLGKMLAESVVEVVVRGTPVAKVPVKMDSDPEIVVNGSMVNALNLTVPEAVLKRARVLK